MSETAAASAGSGRLRHRLDLLRQRLQGRPDSEHEQAIVRIVIVTLAFALFPHLRLAAATSPTSP